MTPDDSSSKYVQQFLALDPGLLVHLGWKSVYDFLKDQVDHAPSCVSSELARQFLARIHDTIFEQDLAGVVLKIQFGEKSDVYEEKYMAEVESGQWTRWNTPREYKPLNGTGRKLLLYDRTRQGITVEFEVEKVVRTDEEADYPWLNVLVPNGCRVFKPPIPLDHIRQVNGFAHFGMHRKDRSPYRNITHEQYRQLVMAQPETSPVTE